MTGQKQYAPFLWLMFAALPFFACKSTIPAGPVAIPAGFDWQGHRGCRGIMPENTIPAFLKALEFDEVTTLELDLAVSSDNQLIVSHEPWFNPAICRLPNGDTIAKRDESSHLIYRMSAEEVRAYDCGSWGNPRFPGQHSVAACKPLLREVVEAVRLQYPGKAASIRWNIEIKSAPEWDGLRHPPVEEFVRLVIAELRTLGLEKNTNVQSFDVRALQAMHRQAPEIELAYLIENINGLDANIRKLGFQPSVYSPYYQLVSRKLVRRCHAQGIKVIPWTINDVPSIRGMIRFGVDGIITDYPDKIGKVSAPD